MEIIISTPCCRTCRQQTNKILKKTKNAETQTIKTIKTIKTINTKYDIEMRHGNAIMKFSNWNKLREAVRK